MKEFKNYTAGLKGGTLFHGARRRLDAETARDAAEEYVRIQGVLGTFTVRVSLNEAGVDLKAYEEFEVTYEEIEVVRTRRQITSTVLNK